MLRLDSIAFTCVDWDTVERVEYPGESGTAFWATVEVADLRLRTVEYSANYLSDHWCSRGHILFVVAGHLTTEFKSGRKVVMAPGQSFHVGQNKADPHRTISEAGAKLFIVD